MVDVSSKQVTARNAGASAFVAMSPQTAVLVVSGGLAKGDALAVARVAGIMAAKKTGDLIPLCHPLALSEVKVDFKVESDGVRVVASAKTVERTGVEMEALVAASVAALTIYDMCKSVDKAISIRSVELDFKSGGRSGDWSRV